MKGRALALYVTLTCAASTGAPDALSAVQAPQHTDTGLPLAPTRTVRFETDEGTWLSLDVSPDGTTIVFDLLGDLYTLPIAGGRAARLTSGMAFDAQPRFSPDGSRLVFTSDRDGWTNVWVSDADGRRPQQITRYRWTSAGDRVSSPVWTPDGRALIVSERFGLGPTAGTRLVEYDVATRFARPLTNHDPGDRRLYQGPAFGKDPDIVYAAMRDADHLSGALWQIARIDRRTLKVYLESHPTAGRHALRPVLSRDGRYLVYGSPSGEGTGLRVVDLTTGGERWLLRSAQRDVLSWAAWDSRDLLPGSAFTPDGRAVLTSYGGKLWRVDVASGRVAAIPFRAAVVQQLGPLLKFDYPPADAPVAVRAIRNPQVAPDLSRVAFTALDRLWVADLLPRSGDSAAVTPRRLTTGTHGEFFPAWSPDGQYIAYAGWAGDSAGAVYRVPATGGTPDTLARSGDVYLKTLYEPGGQRVLAVRAPAALWRSPDGEGGASGLELVALAPGRGAPARVASLPAGAGRPGGGIWKWPIFVYGQPHMLPGLNQILVRDQDSGLVAISPDDSRRTPWVRFSGAAGWTQRLPAEVLLSPDARHVLLLHGTTYRPILLSLGNHAPSEAALSLDEGQLPADIGRRDLAATSADYLGWTPSGIPYYTIGHTLYLGTKAPDGANDPALTFRRIAIRLQLPADRAPGAILLRGARVITMRGREVIEQADLLVRDGRVAALGQRGSVAVPEGAHVMDLPGTTMLPGFLDIHSHVGARVFWGVHAEQDWRLLVELAFGVTTLRDPVGYSTDLMALQERSATGNLLAPRLYTVWPNTGDEFFGDGTGIDLARTRDILRLWSSAYRTETLKQYAAGGRRTRQFIAIAAREQGLTSTTEGFWNTAMDLTMVLDGYAGLEHGMPASPQYRDVIQLLVQSGITQTHTMSASHGLHLFYRRGDPWVDSRLRQFVPPEAIATYRDRHQTSRASVDVDLETFREFAAQAAKIVAAGGCVGLGSHSNMPGLGVHWELWTLAMGGMPNHDVLHAGTRCSAEAIGHGRDLGSLEVGKIADLQVLAQNPLEDIHHTATTRYVMKGGRLYDAATLAEVWPRHTSPVRLWWHGQ